ncbi:MAG: hypothetical protein KDC16_11335, partial [Saprospiraceae bacterium]|nr:hypothetical protein [Saprospiraceae bacterium]
MMNKNLTSFQRLWKNLIFLFILIFSVSNKVRACDASLFSISSSTDNGDGTTTYCFDITIELGSLDVSFYGFVLQFNSSSGTPSIVAGTFPSMITDADLTSGTLVEDLIGLTGSDINSEAQDSDWNIYDNMINVLSYESFWSAASNDISFSLCVDVNGCVEDILFDASVNSGSSQCEFTETTGLNCSAEPCNAIAPGLDVDFDGSLQGTSTTYDIEDGVTIGFDEDGTGTLPPAGDGSFPAGYGLALFDCDPTGVPGCDLTDPVTFSATSLCPCFLGIDVFPTSDTNDGGESSSIPGNSTLWVILITLDYVDCSSSPCELDPDFDGDGCFDSGDLVQLNYLPPNPCDCSNPVCGGMHWDCSGDAEDSYFGSGSEAQYTFSPGLPFTNGTIYTLCWEYTTGADEDMIGFVNAIGYFDFSCDFDRVYHVYESTCGSEISSVGPADFGTDGLEYNVNPNTTYTFCVEITATLSSCNELVDTYVWLYNAAGSGGCGTCASPCTDTGMGMADTYDDRSWFPTGISDPNSCWTPDCPIDGPAIVTNCWNAVADGTGFLGFANIIDDGSAFCFPGDIEITWELQEQGDCGNVITPDVDNANGVSSGFNPEYSGLTPNGNYTICITYDIPGGFFDCGLVEVCTEYYGSDCTAILEGTSMDGYACKDDGRSLEEITSWVETNFDAGPNATSSAMTVFLVFCDPPTLPMTEAYFNANALDAILETTDNIGDFINTNGDYEDPISGTICTDEIYLVPITIIEVTGSGFIFDWDCFDTDEVIQVDLGVPPMADATADPMTICSGESADLTATGGGTYMWSNGLGTNATVTVSPTMTTTYTVTVTDDSGNCESTAEVTVMVDTPEIPTFSITDEYCEGDAVDALPGTSDNGINGTWSPTTINNTTSGSYTFTPAAGECAEEFILNVTINAATTPTFNITDEYCEGDAVDALPGTSDNGINGTWSPT